MSQASNAYPETDNRANEDYKVYGRHEIDVERCCDYDRQWRDYWHGLGGSP